MFPDASITLKSPAGFPRGGIFCDVTVIHKLRVKPPIRDFTKADVVVRLVEIVRGHSFRAVYVVVVVVFNHLQYQS